MLAEPAREEIKARGCIGEDLVAGGPIGQQQADIKLRFGDINAEHRSCHGSTSNISL
jgi:hypothetical protein